MKKRWFVWHDLKSRMMMTYVVITLLVFLLLSELTYNLSASIIQDNASKALMQIAVSTRKQLDVTLREMESVANVIAEDDAIVSRMPAVSSETWSKITQDNLMLEDSGLRTRFLNSMLYIGDVYRVSIINANGDIVSSRPVEVGKPVVLNALRERKYFEEGHGAGLKLSGIHYDPWIADKHIQVFSVKRSMRKQGQDIAWVEVQQQLSTLDQICSTRIGASMNITIIDSKNNVVYSTWKLLNKMLIHHYMQIAQTGEGVVTEANPISKISEMVAFSNSKYNGLKVFVIENDHNFEKNLNSLRITIMLIGISMAAASMAVFYYFAGRLTTPLAKLAKDMEQIGVGRFRESADNSMDKRHDSEIEMLNHSFRNMVRRLDHSIEAEVKSRALHLNARFEALQACINPHFLFNTLSVIVGMADEAGNDEIAEVCHRLSKLLRYSIPKENTIVTIRQEIQYTCDYLFLMKKRYEDRLVWEIDMDEQMLDFSIPRFVVQPIVENSIMHGYENSMEHVMRIRIWGRIQEGSWELTVEDNGDGFTPEKLASLRASISNYANRLLSDEDVQQLTIGGMGLTNTFARLTLFFSGQLRFEIKNREKGACIAISGPIMGGERK